MKEKKCKVCSLFDERKFNDEIRFNINKLIKLKQPTEILNKETKSSLTDYLYKIHRTTCLIDFEIPIEDQNVNDQEPKNLNNQKLSNDKLKEILNTESIIENFRNMDFEEKQKLKFKLLEETEYLILNTIHYQLINGRIDSSFKTVVPKDDISALKIVNELMKNNEQENFEKPLFDPIKEKIDAKFLEENQKELQKRYDDEKSCNK